MKIKIDLREKDLIKLVPALLKSYNLNYEVLIENLPLGDVIVSSNSDEELVIIERKKLSDLASSIMDGRYKEQSYRLHHHEVHNHNIHYLIEGNLHNYSSKYSRIDVKTLYSTMISLNYYKGFSVIRTLDLTETAEYIIRLVDKINREKQTPFYNNISVLTSNIENNESNEEPLLKLELVGDKDVEVPNYDNYNSVIKKVKKDNITPENIGEIILSQIPGISNVISKAIKPQYPSPLKDC